MHQLIFTKRGWIDENGFMPYATYKQDGKGHLIYGIEMKKVPEHTSCFYPATTSAIPAPHIDDVMTLLFNIAIGQRSTTPMSQNKFIGRYNKTFFSGSSHIAYTIRQEHITNISAFANYVHMNKRDPKCGVCERLFDEYCFIVGNIAYTLYRTAKRHEAIANGEKDIEETRKTDLTSSKKIAKHNLKAAIADDELVEKLIPMISSIEDAVEIAEGVMIACCVHDHTSIDKDRNSVHIKKTIGHYQEQFQDVLEAINEIRKNKENVITPKLLEALRGLSQINDDAIWIIRDGTDDIINWFVYDSRTDDCENRYVVQETSTEKQRIKPDEDSEEKYEQNSLKAE